MPFSFPLDIVLVGKDGANVGTILARQGHRTFPVATGEAMLRMLDARKFDAVVVAGAAADGSAADVVARLRRTGDSATALMPVVVVAATAENGDEALTAGADEVVGSPLTAAQIAKLCAALSPPVTEKPPVGCVVGGNRLLALFAETLYAQRRALTAKSLTAGELGDIAHRLKGSAANMGYDTLTAVAAEITTDMGGRAADEPCPPILHEQLRTSVEAAIVAVEGALRKNEVPI
jgi:CheY-like chemotaxis protein